MKEEYTDKEKVEYFKRIVKSQHKLIITLQDKIKRLEEVK